MDISRRIYAAILRLYPPAVREEYGRQMQEAFEDSWAEARSPRFRGVVALLLMTLLDLIRSLPPLWWEAITSRRTSPERIMENLKHDLKYAVRLLTRNPGYTLAAALTVGLGIGATTTILSVTNAILLRAPTGVRDADELVTAHVVWEDGSSFHAFSYDLYRDYRDGENGLSDLAAYDIWSASLNAGERPEIAMSYRVTPNYFDVVRARPALGRFFLAEENVPANSRVAVLGHGLWRRRFGSDSSVIGRTITVNRQPFTIVGVAERGFTGHMAMLEPGLFVPLATVAILDDPRLWERRDSRSFETIGRLAAGVSLETARSRMAVLARQIQNTTPATRGALGIDVRSYSPVFAQIAGPATAFFGILLGISALILTIASVNVGGMILARASARGKEIAVRFSLGAGRWRLIRQLVTESVLLFAMGGLIGTLLAFAGAAALASVDIPDFAPIALDFTPDITVLLLAALVTLLAGVIFGLVPAWQTTRHDLSAALVEGARETGLQRSRLRSALIVIQVAGSTVLLVGAGLFARALLEARSIDPGFDPSGVTVTSVDLGVAGYTDEEGRRFFDELQRRIRGASAIEAAGLVRIPPLAMSNAQTSFLVEGRGTAEEDEVKSDFNVITPGYLETLSIPLVRGRPLSEADEAESPPVALINETLARREWPERDPMGQRISLDGGETWAEVVGVTADGKYRTLGEEPRAMVYLPLAQEHRQSMTVVAASGLPSAEVARLLEAAVHDIDPDLPLTAQGPLSNLNELSLLPNRVAAGLGTLFGVAGLLLAAVGLYGVLMTAVNQRTREIGIRMALGAESGRVRRMVLGDGLKLTGAGLVIGVALALPAARLLRSLLFGLSPADPMTFTAVALILVAAAAAASYVPARRATGINPVDALRAE